ADSHRGRWHEIQDTKTARGGTAAHRDRPAPDRRRSIRQVAQATQKPCITALNTDQLRVMMPSFAPCGFGPSVPHGLRSVTFVPYLPAQPSAFVSVHFTPISCKNARW